MEHLRDIGSDGGFNEAAGITPRMREIAFDVRLRNAALQ